MKKLLRIGLRAGAVVLVLLVLLMIGLALFLPVDRMAQRLETEIEKATGAEVAIGDAGLSWWPRLGVSLDDVTFQGSGTELARATGAANEIGTFSGRAGQLLIRIPLGPLLSRRLEVEAASLQSVDLKLEHRDTPLELAGGQVEVTDLRLDLENLPAEAATGTAPGDRIPESLSLAFRGRADSFSQKGLTLREIGFQGGLDTRILTVREMAARVGEGTLEGQLEIDYERDPRGILDFEATATEVPAAELLLPYVPDVARRLEAELGGRLRGNLLLGDEDTVRQSLSLTGSFTSGEGTLLARDWLGEVLPYLGDRQDLVDIRFRSLSHEFRVDQGRYLVENLTIDGLDTRWEGDGSIGLDGDLDMNLKVLLPPGFTPDLGQWSMLADVLRDESGRVKLDLSVRGPGRKPQVGLNLGTLKEAARSDAGEAVKKGLGGLLDKWKSR